MEQSDCNDGFSIIIGTYTAGNFAKEIKGQGISIYTFDPITKKVSLKTIYHKRENYSYLTFDSKNKNLYAVSEEENSFIEYLNFDDKDFSLKEINSLGPLGYDSCHICLDEKNEILIVSNYNSGSFNIIEYDAKEGRLKNILQTVVIKFENVGPIKERQEMSHIHSSCCHPTKNILYLADLGSDKIFIYKYDPESKKVFPHEKQSFFKVQAGSGPRHICVNKDGRFLYCLNELSSTISVFSIQNENCGCLDLLQTISAISSEFKGENYSAEIKIHPNNKFLLVSNRGMDTISVYSINSDNGMLKHLNFISTKGNNFKKSEKIHILF